MLYNWDINSNKFFGAQPGTTQEKQPGEITRDISIEQQDSIREIIADSIINILWDKVFYLSSFAAESVTTSSSTEDVTAKEVDTSEGKKFDPSLDSRYRVNFYVNTGQTNITAYICSPATNTTFTTDVPIADSDNISYVGIKITGTIVYLVSKTKGQTEKLVRTNKTITDNTTHTLEIFYRPVSSDIYFDNELIGSISNNLLTNGEMSTFYPYLTSVKSSSGSVNLTLENYEFAQKKKWQN